MDSAGEKSAIIINGDEPEFVRNEKTMNQKVINLYEGESVAAEIDFDIRDIKLSPKYCVFYQMQLYNEKGQKMLVILCRERELTNVCKSLKKCNSKNKKGKEGDKKDKTTKDKEKSKEETRPSKKIKEEADKKLDKAITEVGLSIVEAGVATIAVTRGDVVGTATGCVLSAYKIKDAITNFKEAKELYDEARQAEKEEGEDE